MFFRLERLVFRSPRGVELLVGLLVRRSNPFVVEETGSKSPWQMVVANSLSFLSITLPSQQLPQFLVGGWPSPLKNMKVSWDDYSQYLKKKMFQTTNQVWSWAKVLPVCFRVALATTVGIMKVGSWQAGHGHLGDVHGFWMNINGYW